MNSRDEIQRRAVNSVVENDYRGFLFAATGFGKSKVTLDILRQYSEENENAKFLWLVPTTRLRDHTVPEEKQKWAQDIYLDIACYASIQKYNVAEYNIVVADECHHITERVYEKGLKDANRFIGISATPPKEEDKQEILSKLGVVVFQYTLDEAVADEIVDDYEVVIIRMALDGKKKYVPAGNKNNRFMNTERAQYEYVDKQCNRMMYQVSSLNSRLRREMRKMNPNAGTIVQLNRDKGKAEALMRRYMSLRTEAMYTYRSKVEAAKELIEALYTEEDRVLILSQRIAVADELHEHTYHSKSKEGLEIFNNGDTNMLSACNALDEGANLGKLTSVFIQQVRSKDRQLVQRIGRAIRKSEKDKARIYILCYEGTQDEKWVLKAIDGLSNVTTTTLRQFKDDHNIRNT